MHGSPNKEPLDMARPPDVDEEKKEDKDFVPQESVDEKLRKNYPIIVIEHCVNCKAHNWNNRHDEDKYRSNAETLAAEI